MKVQECIQKTDLTYCGHFLIKTEGGAKNYKRDHRLPLAWRSFTVAFVQRKGYGCPLPYYSKRFPYGKVTFSVIIRLNP